MSVLVALAVAAGCGGLNAKIGGQPDAPIVPQGGELGSGGVAGGGGETDTGGVIDTGGVMVGTGGIIIGSGGAPSTGGTPASVGDAAPDTGPPPSGGVVVPDAGLPATGGTPVDAASSGGGSTGAGGVGGVVASGGVPGTGGTSSGGCGQPGFPCCTGNTCNNDGCCVAGICMRPGGACVGLGDGLCAAGVCGSCGGLGLPCCTNQAGAAGSCTAPGTTCRAGTCAKCGELGFSCCDSASAGSAGVCSSAGSMCDSTDLCVPCGSPGTACCQDNQCAGSGCCVEGMCLGENAPCGAGAGTCQAGRCSGCGAAAQPCCSGSTCYNGLMCNAGTCSLCGGAGQACCLSTSTTGQCQTGLACSAPSGGLCARCGQPGDICCAGDTCNDGCCSAGRCLTSGSCPADGGAPGDTPVDQCATGAVPCTALAHFTGVQVLDGNDDEFCNVPSFDLSFSNAAKVLENNTAGKSYPERAVARVAWDAAGLHAFVRVYDSTFTPAGSTQSWNGDGIELMFSSSTAVTGLTYSDKNTLHVIISPPVAQYSLDTASSGTQYALPSSEYVVGSDSTGYFAELSLPWPGGTAPGAGTQIMFEMQLNLADGVTSYSDLYVRDAQAILYLGTVSTSGCTQPFCDDRAWCKTTLAP